MSDMPQKKAVLEQEPVNPVDVIHGYVVQLKSDDDRLVHECFASVLKMKTVPPDYQARGRFLHSDYSRNDRCARRRERFPPATARGAPHECMLWAPSTGRRPCGCCRFWDQFEIHMTTRIAQKASRLGLTPQARFPSS